MKSVADTTYSRSKPPNESRWTSVSAARKEANGMLAKAKTANARMVLPIRVGDMTHPFVVRPQSSATFWTSAAERMFGTHLA